jgi:hypothetical protein
MNSSRTEIDTWFIEGTLASDDVANPEVWEAIFDADRQLVHTKIGPLRKIVFTP